VIIPCQPGALRLPHDSTLDRPSGTSPIEQLKNGVRALHAPLNTLEANWAYMVIASLAWSIKSA
jgi:hypothetical protein